MAATLSLPSVNRSAFINRRVAICVFEMQSTPFTGNIPKGCVRGCILGMSPQDIYARTLGWYLLLPARLVCSIDQISALTPPLRRRGEAMHAHAGTASASSQAGVCSTTGSPGATWCWRVRTRSDSHGMMEKPPCSWSIRTTGGGCSGRVWPRYEPCCLPRIPLKPPPAESLVFPVPTLMRGPEV
jgi:hypothetical protein